MIGKARNTCGTMTSGRQCGAGAARGANTIVAWVEISAKIYKKQNVKTFASILDRIWARQYVARDFKGA
ncbi:MAG: hypothetical protein KDJ20_14570 [Hyphomicrobiales bacterium]|nr:hypothetical protein [Rhodoblastus sp.]MCB9999949.1 hypothetical protein [Methylobacteriaceae bacterium]MCC2101210.1 hypothetical protein [Hyphomicrobiales bacterium]MCB1524157.1 hypothetical protein [Rhodoblastus sp.]MCC0001642.1 hypothetical protein [Methylobacteriaceae bacterium]